MKVNEYGDKVTLELNGKIFEGHTIKAEDFYFNCKYIFENTPKNMLLEDLQNITTAEFCDDTFIMATGSSDTYLGYIQIGKKKDKTYYRTVFLLHGNTGKKTRIFIKSKNNSKTLLMTKNTQ